MYILYDKNAKKVVAPESSHEAEKFYQETVNILKNNEYDPYLNIHLTYTVDNKIKYFGMNYHWDSLSLIVGINNMDFIECREPDEVLENFKKFINNLNIQKTKPLCSDVFEQQIQNLSFDEQKHVRTLCALLCLGSVVTRRTSTDPGSAYNLDDDLKPKITRLVLSGLTAEKVLHAIRYQIPEDDNEYEAFIGNCSSFPPEWLDSLYTKVLR